MRSEDFGISAVRVILYDQGSVWGFPLVLAATCRTPPAALPLFMPAQNTLRDTQPALVFLLNLTAAYSLTFARAPKAELAVSQEFFPNNFPNRLTSPRSMLGAVAHLQSASQCCAAQDRAPPCAAFRAATCRLFRFRLTLCICQDRSGPTLFFDGETFPQFLRSSCSMPNAAHSLPRKAFCSTTSLHFDAVTRRSPCFSRLTLWVTPLAQVDRTSFSSVFCHTGHKLVEVEALFSTPVIALGMKLSFFHVFLISSSTYWGAETQSCVSADALTRPKDLCFSSVPFDELPLHIEGSHLPFRDFEAQTQLPSAE